MKKAATFLFIIMAVACTDQKSKNQEALEQRITAFMKDPEHMLDVSNYEALSYSRIDTLSWPKKDSDRAYKLQLLYQGLNSASRQVKREADVFFNRQFEVIEVVTTKYLDAMSKEEYKNLGKTISR